VNGVRCAGCDGQGEEMIAECPYDLITPDIWQVIELAEFARKGNLPITAGVLDQAQCIMDGIRCVWSAERRAGRED
jgi:hypothetical protein